MNGLVRTLAWLALTVAACTTTLPGVREAIEERRWPEVDQYMNIIAGVLNAYSERLDEAAAALKQ